MYQCKICSKEFDEILPAIETIELGGITFAVEVTLIDHKPGDLPDPIKLCQGCMKHLCRKAFGE